MDSSVTPVNVSKPTIPDWLAVVRQKVEGLRYGVVQLIVHDGKVTQIERTEKTRLVTGHDSQVQI